MILKTNSNKRVHLALISLMIVTFVMSIPRLMPGIPMGVDSTSHLYKLLFLFDNLKAHHYLPSWSPEWYGGIYLFKYYPPLGYYIALAITYIGFDPLTSYKIVELIFYLLTPLTIYLLSREFSLTKVESLSAAFIFSLSPSIIENLLFYDRYPNILSLLLFILLLLLLTKSFKSQNKSSRYGYLFIASITLASIILIHHLSAVYAIFILIIFLIANIGSGRIKSLNINIVYTISFSLLLSLFWLGPFMSGISQLTENPFYNRNVIDTAYMKLSYFATNTVTYSFGVVVFLLAMVALYIHSKHSDLHLKLTSLFFGFFLSGLGLFEISVQNYSSIQVLSQILVMIGFLSILYVIMRLKTDTPTRFLLLWFILFLWFSLGGYAVPFSTNKALPFINVKPIQTLWMSLDIQRYWLFLTIPMSILAAKPLSNLLENLRKTLTIRKVICLVFVIIIGCGAGIKVYYSITQPINEYLPQTYTSENTLIPQSVINYFKAEKRTSRILCVRCPFWIYILPRYVDKHLIDGWYPQGKILPRLLEINDYRINDLEASESQDRIPTWKNLIKDAEELAITWIMIGDSNQTFQRLLIDGSGFVQDKVILHKQGEITIYKYQHFIPLIETIPQSQSTLYHVLPDCINIKLDESIQIAQIRVKEAYSTDWITGKNCSDDEILSIQISSDDEGYVLLYSTKDQDLNHLYIYKKQIGITIFDSISVISLVFLSIICGVYTLRKKK